MIWPMADPQTPATTAEAFPPPMLRGELVWLRASSRADFAEDVAAINHPDTGPNLGLKMPVSPDGAAEFTQKALSQQGKTLYSFTICPLGETRGIGNVTLRDVDRENGNAELTIVILDRAYQGRGYGTDALRCVMDFGFGELRLERIYLHVFDFNARARRSYEKAGFAVDATLRHARFHHGAHHDVLVMSILRDEWLVQDRPRAWDSRD
jgi:RimJ/RimL family protein N-acetyltransferase